MPAKTEQLQIRVTRAQKAALKRVAAAAGQDVSSYVLERALPDARRRFGELLVLLGDDDEDARYVLAQLNDLLSTLAVTEYRNAVVVADLRGVSPFLQNYVAAMVEHAAVLKGTAPPAWTREVAPLEVPHFATPLKSLRLHLLRASPVAYKRRNIFVDAAVGARV
jgi:uncharacterized protein (DUF1778 family)